MWQPSGSGGGEGRRVIPQWTLAAGPQRGVCPRLGEGQWAWEAGVGRWVLAVEGEAEWGECTFAGRGDDGRESGVAREATSVVGCVGSELS